MNFKTGYADIEIKPYVVDLGKGGFRIRYKIEVELDGQKTDSVLEEFGKPEDAEKYAVELRLFLQEQGYTVSSYSTR